MKNRLVSTFAVFAVVLMMAMAIVPAFGGAQDTDATTSSWGSDYTYTLTMSNTTNTSSPITFTLGGDWAGKTKVTAGNAGDFNFDSNGYGPFNSFYALFSSSGEMLGHLNPNDLSKYMDGTSAPITTNNVMWVLPTVYWKVSGNTLTMSNQASSGGVAYAHTINGHTYAYLAYGVYEGTTTGTYNSSSDQGDNTFGSYSGKNPRVSAMREIMREEAGRSISNSLNTEGGYGMLWNFYQWRLYQLCVYSVTGTYAVQNVFGAGHVSSSGENSGSVTGRLNDVGPYSNTGSSSNKLGAKAFIENAWGSVWDFVDDCVWWPNGSQNQLWLGQNDSSKILDKYSSSSSSKYSTNAQTNKTSQYYVTASASGLAGTVTTTNAIMWGFPSASGGSGSAGTTDYFDVPAPSNSYAYLVHVGGSYNSSVDNAGLAYATCYDLYFASTNYGSRLAFVFDADPAAGNKVTFDSNGGNNTPAAVTVKKNTSLTLPSPGTKSGYTFDGWCVSSTSGTNVGVAGASYTPSANVTLVAKWTANYVVTYKYYNGNADTTTTVSSNGSSVTLPSPSRSHYSFDGWYTAANGGGTKAGNASATYTPSGDITLHANWTISEYVITAIDSVDSTTIATQTVSIGDSYSNIPTHSGYLFMGWYDSDSGGDRLDTSTTGTYTPAGSTVEITIYAHFQQYYVNIDHSVLSSVFEETLTGSSLTGQSMIGSSGSYVVLSDLGYESVLRNGVTYLYRHTGWTESSGSNTTTLSIGSQIANSSTHTNGVAKTYYSTWVPVIVVTAPNNIGTVSYDSSYFAQDSTTSLYYLKSGVTSWPNLGTTTGTNSGYTHVGYTLDTTNMYYQNSDQIPALAKSARAVASFVQPSITVKFWSSSDSHLIATLAVPSGSTCLLFSPSLADVYAFTGWYWDSACTYKFDPSTALTTTASYVNSSGTTVYPYDSTNRCFHLWASAVELLYFTSDPTSEGVITYASDYSSFLFDATNSENAAKVVWNFGDGSTSTDRIVYHAYTNPGKYDVTLTATNYNGESDTSTYTVYWQVSEDDGSHNGWFWVAVVLCAIVGFLVVRFIVLPHI